MLTEVFEQKEIEVMARAHQRALEFLSHGEAQNDPSLAENLAFDIVWVSRTMNEVNFLELTNRVIHRYRYSRASAPLRRYAHR